MERIEVLTKVQDYQDIKRLASSKILTHHQWKKVSETNYTQLILEKLVKDGF
jgi:hypothetical protein